MMATMKIRNQTEADAMNAHALHCGTVRVADEWDTATAWPEVADRRLARLVLRQYRRDGTLPTDEQRRQLAVCCR